MLNSVGQARYSIFLVENLCTGFPHQTCFDSHSTFVPESANSISVMAYYSALGPNNYCCYREYEKGMKQTVDIAAPIDYVWAILTNVHDYSTWSDFALSGSIDEGAVVTLKDNATVVQSDDGRIHKVKAVKGMVSRLVDKKVIEFSFDRGQVGWSVGFAFYLEDKGAAMNMTRVANVTRFFGPYHDQVEKVLNERMTHLKLFCENSRTRANSIVDHRHVEPSCPPLEVETDPSSEGEASNEHTSTPEATEEFPLTPRRAKRASITDELLKLVDLKERGLLSEEEYAAAKRRLLYDMNGYTRLYG